MIGSIRKHTSTAFLVLLCCTAWVAASAQVAAQAPRNASLTVRVAGIRNATGNLLVTLRRDDSNVVETRTIDIDPKTLTAQVVFQNVPEGAYGVVVVHDENKNGKLDFNEMGMPLEGYGYSNNPARTGGPAPFDKTKFALTAPSTSIEIALIYWL